MISNDTLVSNADFLNQHHHSQESAYQLLLLLLTWVVDGEAHLVPMATSLLVMSKVRAERHLSLQPHLEMHKKACLERMMLGSLPSNLRSCRHLQDRLLRPDLWFCAHRTRLCHVLPLLQRGFLRLRLPHPSPPRSVSILSPHKPTHRSPGLSRSDRSVLQRLLPLLYTMECCEW